MRSPLLLMGLILVFRLQIQAQSSETAMGSYRKADSLAACFPHYPLTDIPTLALLLTEPLEDDTQKFRALFRWVCDNIENDYGLYERNKRKREKFQRQPDKLRAWEEQFSPKVVEKLIHDYSTVCSGYAYLLSELALYAGIPCEIVHGYGRTAVSNIGGTGLVNHSWNAVRLNGQWYLCDATWSSGLVLPEKGFIHLFSEGYFLSDPELFLRNHYPLDSTWILTDHPMDLTAFLNGPLIYRAAFEFGVEPVFPADFENTLEQSAAMVIRVRQAQELPIRLMTNDSGTFKDLAVSPQKIPGGLYEWSPVFSHRGVYVVHAMVNGQVLFTYQVKVVKRN